MNQTVERVRAVLRLLAPEEITPTGRRMIEKVLDAEDEVDALTRDRAIRKINTFLQKNYPCQECEGDECDELDEAATIVDIVEETYAEQ